MRSSLLRWIPVLGLQCFPSNAQTVLLERTEIETMTPYTQRYSLSVGDQAGGPVRYNTRFPTSGKDPNPASYYHAQTFAAVAGEFSIPRGAWLIEAMVRRDFSHPTQIGRKDQKGDYHYEVREFEFNSKAFAVGWVFGTQYREAPWRASLAAVFDQATVKTTVYQAEQDTESSGTSTVTALSLRGRVSAKVWGEGVFDIHAGPELHIPIYSRKKSAADDAVSEWLADDLDLRHSAAIGVVLESGFRF